MLIVFKKTKSSNLAPMEVEILLLFPLKSKRLKRTAGRMLIIKQIVSAPKENCGFIFE
jgi:hypothetical protein